MGIPAPSGVSASGLPPAGDQANGVLSGAFTAVGPSAPFAFRGPFNVSLFALTVASMTTTAGTCPMPCVWGASALSRAATRPVSAGLAETCSIGLVER